MWKNRCIALGILLVGIGLLRVPTIATGEVRQQATPRFEMLMRLGHGTAQTSALSPSQEVLAIGGSLGVWVFNLQTETLTYIEGIPPQIDLLAWSPDGQKLAVAADSRLYIWDFTKLALSELPDLDYRVQLIAWNFDGSRLATVDGTETIHIWDTAASTRLKSFQAGTRSIEAIAWRPSPNSNQLASVEIGFVRVWDTDTGEEVNSFFDGNQYFSIVAWSPDGTLLGAASDDEIYVWEVASDELKMSRPRDIEGVTALSWRPDGSELVEIGSDTTTIWESSTFRETRRFGIAIGKAGWTPYGSQLVNADEKEITFWDATTGILVARFEIGGFTSPVLNISWSPDNQHIVSDTMASELNLWSLEGTLPLRSLTIPIDARSLSWSPDWNFMAGAQTGATLTIWDWSLLVAETLKGNLPDENANGYITETLVVSQFASFVTSVWNLSSDLIVAPSESGNVPIWNINDPTPLLTLEHNATYLETAAWNPDIDANQVAIGGSDGIIRIWDTKSGSLIMTIAPGSSNIYALAWSPDGTTLVSGSFDGTIHVWDATSNFQLVTSRNDFHDNAYSLVWSPDGTQLASGGRDRTLIIWDTTTWQPLDILAGHTDDIRAIAWNADGTQVATGSMDGTIIIWGIQ